MTEQQIKILIELLESVEQKQDSQATNYRVLKQEISALMHKYSQSSNEFVKKAPIDYSQSFVVLNGNIKLILNKIESMNAQSVKEESKIVFNKAIYWIVIVLLGGILALGTLYHFKEIDKEKQRRYQIIVDIVKNRRLGIDSIAKSYGMTDEHIKYIKKNNK